LLAYLHHLFGQRPHWPFLPLFGQLPHLGHQLLLIAFQGSDLTFAVPLTPTLSAHREKYQM
jgi:hypothetical protein